MDLHQIQMSPEKFSAWIQQGGAMREASSGADVVLIISQENGKVRLSSTCPTEKAYLLVLSFIDEFRRTAQEPASDTLMRVIPPAALRGETRIPEEAYAKKPQDTKTQDIKRQLAEVPE